MPIRKYVVMRYQRAEIDPRTKQIKPRFAYSSDPDKRKEEYKEHPADGPLLEGAIAGIYHPTKGRRDADGEGSL